jgi:hypothetical protein
MSNVVMTPLTMKIEFHFVLPTISHIVLITAINFVTVFSRQEEQSRNNSFLPSVSPKNDGEY